MSSNLWIFANDNSKAPYFRTQYVAENGGEWINTHKGWQYRPDKPKAKKIKKTSIFRKIKKSI